MTSRLANGMPSNFNFALLLDGSFQAHAARPALHHADEELDYAALAALTDGWAAVLARRGAGPGAVVALWLPNSPAFVAAYIATLRLGAIVAPLGVLLRAGEVVQRLALVNPTTLVTTAQLAAQLPAATFDVIIAEPQGHGMAPAGRVTPASRAEDDVAVIIFSSGTTGAAKAAEITHRGLAWNTQGLIGGLALTSADVQLGVAPFSHVLGMTGVMSGTLVSGGTLALQERFDAAATLELMKRAGVTGVAGAPSMFLALAREAKTNGTTHRLRFMHAGGSAFPAESARTVSDVFGCAVHGGYGMSEVGGAISLEPVTSRSKPGSVGRPLPGSELRVADLASGSPVPTGERGEVHVRSPSVMRGYRGDAVGTRAALSVDGWLATGDIGYIDADGDLCLVDRRKELIIRSGYNVYPAEVEQVLLSHADVAEAAVVGIPHHEHGEEIVALVVPAGEGLDPDALKAFAKERLAAYKYPRHIIPVSTLPKGATGKIAKKDIDRAELLELVRARSAGGPPKGA